MSHRKNGRIEESYVLFGANVADVRLSFGMTQDEVAKLVGLSRTSIVNIENGNQRVLLQDVQRFAEALGCNPKRLLKGLYL